MKRLISTLVIPTLLASLLAACGGKQQQPTTPSNSADAKKSDGAMGGKTYGGAMTATPTPTGDAPPADPCAGP